MAKVIPLTMNINVICIAIKVNHPSDQLNIGVLHFGRSHYHISSRLFHLLPTMP